MIKYKNCECCDSNILEHDLKNYYPSDTSTTIKEVCIFCDENNVPKYEGTIIENPMKMNSRIANMMWDKLSDMDEKLDNLMNKILPED